ncbi:uncharacterized protein LOC9629811 isoform X1 [Selaginella moellendorffii]|uniref:uncharacterized protein LOC9629811 isoform X1 n=1 Tax=Selaginella moellendorffii TaxID=88036 RepID=UPI000D1CDCB2|nr:uncharacterized protein LOC9629811 isoform X1 [Selaginella moellendorffii]|eukprot:XP_024517193.1 uncharacterized protein LOC9629811 isoform X1 [Selaginella moellendorffii]
MNEGCVCVILLVLVCVTTSSAKQGGSSSALLESVKSIVVKARGGKGGEGCLDCPDYNRLVEAELSVEDGQDQSNRNRKRDIRLAIILGSFSAFIALLICGPLCCICYGAKRIRDMRSKAAATHSLMFAEQWRAYNLFMPFNEEEELGQHALSWSAWQFVYRGIPDELNGLSTAIFQSIPPVSGCLRSTTGQPLQQIRLNPGCARLRRCQSLQCLLPLSPSAHPPNCLPNVNYFEMTILSFSRNGKNGRSSGSISGRVGIGLAARPAPPFRLPGLDLVSLGYHSNGSVYINDPHDGVATSRRWNYVGVTVGCGYDLDRSLVYFTHNGGQQMTTDFTFRADGPMPSTTPHLFPVVGADCDITVVVNLGQTEFMFAPANAGRCVAFEGGGSLGQEDAREGREVAAQAEVDVHGQRLIVQQECQQQQQQQDGDGRQSFGDGGNDSSSDPESEVYFSALEEAPGSFLQA